MDEPTALTDLVRRHRDGDPEAARELFAWYAQRLSHLAEQHLSHKLSGRVDGDDVVQSVFRTFFRRTARGEFQIDSRVVDFSPAFGLPEPPQGAEKAQANFLAWLGNRTVALKVLRANDDRALKRRRENWTDKNRSRVRRDRFFIRTARLSWPP